MFTNLTIKATLQETALDYKSKMNPGEQGQWIPGNQTSLISRLTSRRTSPATVLEPEKQPSLHRQAQLYWSKGIRIWNSESHK
ncbi:1614_t:CDS:2 [Dentiscutata heterogama]|uniref:1614_t:CDS:1 n=1 Tax=Dentiscutata heterogama TaxID=1316150 RepID=A0ACA9KBJ6_9GLOM|nr:1614_t:CDS:2 [Dentiscutata heterogama]